MGRVVGVVAPDGRHPQNGGILAGDFGKKMERFDL
jgi:hypothetical protein